MIQAVKAIEAIPTELVGVDLHGLIPPRLQTLAIYGLDYSRWLHLAQIQNFVCAVCGKLPASGRLCIDHVHVAGWAALRPEARVLYLTRLLIHNPVAQRFRVAVKGIARRVLAVEAQQVVPG